MAAAPFSLADSPSRQMQVLNAGESPRGATPTGSDNASVMTVATNTAEATLEEHILARVGLIVSPPPTASPAVRAV